ncbi:MAG: cytochrome c biogenesis CcdA family protein [Deltaproteobacteria bacterium]|nr:cytochrome c biogenesis CcdA family protein [Deltaproteobacteria bacterium]
MSELQQFTQQWLEVLAYSLRVGYPFGAGMVSTVNPCGFAMLPAYLSLYLGTQDNTFYQRSIALRTLKALFVGLTVSAGFVVLFAVIGTGVSAGGRFLIPAMPWIAIVIGVGLVILGLWMLTGRAVNAEFFAKLASRIGDPRSIGVRGFFLFGVAFGAASLSCTLPIFLVVVGSALATGEFLSGLVQFVSYGMGMGLVLIVLTLGTALFKEGIVLTGLRGLFHYVERVAAVLLVVAGSYIVYYWLFKGGLINMFA